MTAQPTVVDVRSFYNLPYFAFSQHFVLRIEFEQVVADLVEILEDFSFADVALLL